MNKFKSFLALTTAVLLFATTACNKEAKYKIGVSQCSEDDWRLKMNEEIMREAMLNNDIEIEIVSADDSNDKQIADLRRFAHQRYDLIIAAPNEAAALTPVIDSIYKSGIPVIIFDRTINSDNYTSFQGADNRSIGHAAANYANSLVGSPQVIELLGNLESTPARDRSAGFRSYADSAGNFRILAEAPCEWDVNAATRTVDSLLPILPQTNVIYAHNDRMAIGAAKAVEKHNRSDIKIIGIDASPEIGLQAVVDTVIDASFIYPTEGRRLIKTALDILHGKDVPKNVFIPSLIPVDHSNAQILLAQQKALKVETDNIMNLKGELDSYWRQHTSQTLILYGSLIIIVLLALVLGLLLRSFWSHRRHRVEIEKNNQELLSQRNEIESQNRQLLEQHTQLKQQHEEINSMVGQLQQATQSKLTFFTNVSHDLRTPLTLIAEPVAQLAAADNLSDEQHALMRLANKNVKVLMRLINQILDFRKVELGKLSLNLVEINMAVMVRDWTEAFHELARKKHVKFFVEIPDNVADYSMAIDVDRIERVLFNLLSNAFKFTPANGSVKVSLERTDNNVILHVADTGKGIPVEDMQRIFEFFFKTEKVNSQGSGIGLALSKAFVELHGGSITVESEEGKRTLFTVSIPIRHVENPADKASSEPDSRRDTAHDEAANLKESVDTELDEIEMNGKEPDENARTLLIIDDNADIRTLVASLMSDSYCVLQAADGATGVRLATKFVPDIIICDVMMPGVDGLETCRRIKSEETTSHIPVLLLTACAMDEQKIDGYDCGADAYLTKPFNAQLLRVRVDSLIANRDRLRESYGKLSVLPMSQEKEKTAKVKTTTLNEASYLNNEFLLKFIEIAEAELDNSEFSVDDIAARMGLSRVQIYRKLKAITNYSPTDVLKIFRLRRASKMLKTTDATISEVCYAVGFTSHSYFTKCYREYFNESPSDTRRRTGAAPAASGRPQP